jgi:hypothetical protein
LGTFKSNLYLLKNHTVKKDFPETWDKKNLFCLFSIINWFAIEKNLVPVAISEQIFSVLPLSLALVEKYCSEKGKRKD